MYTSLHIIPSENNTPEVSRSNTLWPLRVGFANEPGITFSLTIAQARTLQAELANALSTLEEESAPS